MDKTCALVLAAGDGKRMKSRHPKVLCEVLFKPMLSWVIDSCRLAEIEELCVELKKDYTIIMVTHNMQQAVRVSDETAFFLLGEVIEYGDTEKMFSVPTDKRTEDYITGRFG